MNAQLSKLIYKLDQDGDLIMIMMIEKYFETSILTLKNMHINFNNEINK